MNRILTGALLAVLAGALPAQADDRVTIQGRLDFAPRTDGTPEDGVLYRRLRGQSAFITTRTASSTSGGQLDGTTSFDSESSNFVIQYSEVFPETNLNDYLGFGYFGVVETVLRLPGVEDSVVDTSLIVAGTYPSALLGRRIDELLPVGTEAQLLAGMTQSFDSPEFFSLLDSLASNPDLLGTIALDTFVIGQSSVDHVRDGRVLTMYSFTGGLNGDEAVDVGYLDTSILRIVPSPGAASLLGLAGVISARRRRVS
jgi:hypothetical protein